MRKTTEQTLLQDLEVCANEMFAHIVNLREYYASQVQSEYRQEYADAIREMFEGYFKVATAAQPLYFLPNPKYLQGRDNA